MSEQVTVLVASMTATLLKYENKLSKRLVLFGDSEHAPWAVTDARDIKPTIRFRSDIGLRPSDRSPQCRTRTDQLTRLLP